jgi:hypothetical protein
VTGAYSKKQKPTSSSSAKVNQVFLDWNLPLRSISYAAQKGILPTKLASTIVLYVQRIDFPFLLPVAEYYQSGSCQTF